MNARSPETLRLLAGADLLLFVSRAFTPKFSEVRRELVGASREFAALVERAGGDQTSALNAAFRAACAEARSMDGALWEPEFNRLFECTVECPINETGYVRRDKGAILGDIAGFYKAFGFKLADRTHEKLDHLVCELEFTALLFVMLANARERGDAEAATVTERALDAFAFEHLGEWLPVFGDRLSQTARLPLFCEIATLLGGVWELICEQNQLPVPEEGAKPEPEDAGTPYECALVEAGIT